MGILSRDSNLDLDRFFNQFGVPALEKELESNCFSPKINITEHDDRYEITAELAGVDKDNLSVSLEDGVLTIQASMESEKSEEEQGRVIRKERHSGSYLRSFNVGRNVNESDISAKFENGLLRLGVPKVAEQKKLNKQIDIH